MNIQSKLEYYAETFGDDPLYKRIQTDDENWLKELFSDPIYFDKVTFENTYSTTQAAELLGIKGKEQTLLNYINRNDCKSYLDVSRQTRFYRYDWKSLFRFKMILLLNDKGFTPMNIAGEIGSKLVVSSANPEETFLKKGIGANISSEDLKLELQTAKIENVKKIFHTLQAFENYRNEKDSLREEKIRIEQVLLRTEEELDMLDARIDDMNDYIALFESTHSANKNEGLFSKLLGKKNKEQQDIEFNERIQKLKDKLKEIESSKQKTVQEIADYKLKLKDILIELNGLNQNPNEYQLLLKGFKKELEDNLEGNFLDS